VKPAPRKSSAFGGPGQPRHPLLGLKMRPEDYGGQEAPAPPANWPPGLVVAIDTREQLPWRFAGPTQATTLHTGDYSIVGLECRIAIERKSQADAYGSIGGGRERFEREWARLAELDFAAVVVESSLDGFLVPPERSQLHPRAAIGTLVAWSIRYGVHVIFASDRRHAEAWASLALRKFFEAYKTKESDDVRKADPVPEVPALGDDRGTSPQVPPSEPQDGASARDAGAPRDDAKGR
jgi:DNA excision repair protein ERCC-4